MTLLLASSGCSPRESDEAALLGRGDALMEANQYRAAAGVYRLAVRADPKNGATRLKLADALRRAEDWTAHRETIVAADLLPHNPDVQLLGASSALALFRFPEAAARVSGVLRDQPENIDALIVLGNATAQLQHSTWALYFLRTKARRAEAFETALREVRPLTSSIDDAKAEQILRSALAIAPQAFEPRVALVNFLWAAGRQDAAADLLRQLADEHPGDLVLNEALGNYFLSRGRLGEGEVYLKSAATSGNREVTLALAEFYVAAGRDTEALALFDAFTNDEPLGSTSIPRAALECRQGQHDTALRRVDEVLKRIPHHGQALQVKAECLVAIGRVTDAVPLARAAVTASPTSAGARYALGQALSASGAVDDAFPEFSEAVRLDPSHRPASRALSRHALDAGRAETAVVMARELLRTDPTDKDAAATLITALIRQRDYAGAARALEPLLARFPGSPDLLVRQGDLHVARGAPGARASYERALALDPDSVDALSRLVSLDLTEKRASMARQRIERAQARQTDRPEYLLLLGEVLLAEGNAAGSEAAYRRLIATDPGHIRASLQLAALLEHQQRAVESFTILERLLERRPSAADARIALATLLQNTGRTAEAQAHYKKVLDANPRAAVAAYKLASLQVEMGESLDAALALAVTAVQELPDDPGANDTIGWIHVRKNLPRVGLPHLERSVRAEPANPIYRYHLGTAYVAVGQRERGRSELTRALALNPGFRFAPEARAALAAASR